MEQIQGGNSKFCGGGSSGNDEIVEMGASLFKSLPVDLISEIISRTSRRDACVLASVSKTFNEAAQSDMVWDKFLPPECASLVPPSPNYSSKKDIYLSLPDNSVLIDDGKKSIWFEKSSGKKCCMLSAMGLTINFGDNRVQWRFVLEPKYEKVAEIYDARWFEIRGKISCDMLSKGTHYSVYVVFKKAWLSKRSYGFDHTPVEAGVGFVGKEATKTLVFLQPLDELSRKSLREALPLMSQKEVETEWESVVRRNVEVPKERPDGWREVELGKFYINNGGCEDGSDEIEISIMETNINNWKAGLLIRGIEIRPERRN